MGSSPLVFIAPNNDGALGKLINFSLKKKQALPWNEIPFIVANKNSIPKKEYQNSYCIIFSS